MSVDLFYREFEANFRGSREEILQRLSVYRPFIEPFLSAPGSRRVIDVGCGRGEWLEFMQSLGMDPHGVDLDDGMLQDCYERGLSAENADAIAYLKTLDDESVAVVSGFHIAEHLPFTLLRELIGEAQRVLRPGGLLILETPNAENITVGTLSFHMDPTHVKPLPPALLSFLPRYYGFARHRVVRLQEWDELRDRPTARLLEVFQGVSPDYAVVAQKAGDAEWLAQFDAIFAKDFGLTLDTLSERFEAGFVEASVFYRERQLLDDHLQRHEAFTVEKLDEHLLRLDGHMRLLDDQLAFGNALTARLEQHEGDTAGRFHELSERIEALARQNAEYQQLISAIYSSTSWKVSWPVRAMGRAASDARKSARQLAKTSLKWVLGHVLSRRTTRAWAWRAANRYPKAANRLRTLIYSGGEAAQKIVIQPFAQSISGRHLSTRTRKIHDELKSRRNDRS